MLNFKMLFYSFLLRIPAGLITLTVLSFGRSVCAYLLGDSSQKLYGKLSLRPAAHLDPIGFLMIILFGIGWSKPSHTKIDSFKFGNWGVFIYYLSGPIACFLMALFTTVLLILLSSTQFYIREIIEVLQMLISFNLSISCVTLLPIPPFTGYYILRNIAPYNLKTKLYEFDKYSMVIFIILVVTGALSIIIRPLYLFLYKLLILIAGVH